MTVMSYIGKNNRIVLAVGVRIARRDVEGEPANPFISGFIAWVEMVQETDAACGADFILGFGVHAHGLR